MNIKRQAFGKTKDGVEASRFILKNTNGMEVHLTDYGANIVKILVADHNGKLDDVVLGYDDVSGYEENSPGLGSFIGRHANRIKDGTFKLNGIEYNLEKNDGNNNLHGGGVGFNKLMYQVKTFEEDKELSVEFSRMSPDMEQGFPGNLNLSVRYTLTEDNELIISYQGSCDQDTIVNLTNHSYFNLSGHNSGTILEQKVWINSNLFTPTDQSLIPTGEMVDVEDTPMDFRILKPIGREINSDYEPLKIAGGYDHNYVLNKKAKEMAMVAKLVDDRSKRVMEVYTDKPGMQLYTGNFLKNERGKEGALYEKWSGVCFETQYFPNAMNTPQFPSSVLKAGEKYSSKTIYKFTREK